MVIKLIFDTRRVEDAFPAAAFSRMGMRITTHCPGRDSPATHHRIKSGIIWNLTRRIGGKRSISRESASPASKVLGEQLDPNLCMKIGTILGLMWLFILQEEEAEPIWVATGWDWEPGLGTLLGCPTGPPWMGSPSEAKLENERDVETLQRGERGNNITGKILVSVKCKIFLFFKLLWQF